MRIIIFEGARGTGKSTIASKIRQKIPETTLINFTGFHDDGEYGLNKISEYYKKWINLIMQLSEHDSTYVFDRFYFSEQVYSKLYKNYNFNDMSLFLNMMMSHLSEVENVKIDIFFLTINDEEELKNRLTRDKVPFAKVNESVNESLKQQDMYRYIFNHFKTAWINRNMNIHTIDTTKKDNDAVYNEILEILKTV